MGFRRHTNTNKLSLRQSSRGFTIIELMIALSILSVILVSAASLMIRIGAMYTKGVNAANLQNANRTIIGDIDTAIQFSGNEPSGCAPAGDIGITCYTNFINKGGDNKDVYSYCIGTSRYSYMLNRKSNVDETNEAQGFTAVPHVLWRDTLKSADSTCPTLDIIGKTTAQLQSDSNSVPDSGYDMVPPNMRLTRFRIEQQPPNTSGVYKIEVWMAYGDSDLVRLGPGGRALCGGVSGTQYCSGSNLTTTVVKRVGSVNNEGG